MELFQEKDDSIIYDSLEEYYNDAKVEFTEEEQKLIDKIIEESNQRANVKGDRLYTHEEVWEKIDKILEEPSETLGENVKKKYNRKVLHKIS